MHSQTTAKEYEHSTTSNQWTQMKKKTSKDVKNNPVPAAQGGNSTRLLSLTYWPSKLCLNARQSEGKSWIKITCSGDSKYTDFAAVEQPCTAIHSFIVWSNNTKRANAKTSHIYHANKISCSHVPCIMDPCKSYGKLMKFCSYHATLQQNKSITA